MTIVDTSELISLAANIEKAADHAGPAASAVMGRIVGQGVAVARSLAPVDTGELRDSITGELVDLAGVGVEGIWGPTAEHGPYVEFGTAYIPPQPYLGPSGRAMGRALPRALATVGAGLALGSGAGLSDIARILEQLIDDQSDT